MYIAHYLLFKNNYFFIKFLYLSLRTQLTSLLNFVQSTERSDQGPVYFFIAYPQAPLGQARLNLAFS